MFRSSIAAGCLLLSFGVVCPLPTARAQADANGRVTGTAAASVTREPELLRVQVQLLAKGKTPKEALANLKARKEAAGAQAVKLGAAKESISFADLSVDSGMSDRQRQMEMMIRSRMPGKAKPAGGETKRPVGVSQTMTAEWPLKSAAPEELILLTHELQEKIKDADLAGKKEAAKLSPEEEELAEEAEQSLGSYGMSNEPEPGVPVFIYVSKVSEAERAKLMAEAFAKARTRAAALAKAAGAQLGPLRDLGGQAQGLSSRSGMGGYRDYENYAYQVLAQQYSTDEEKQIDEAVGHKPGKVTYSVTINASFELK